MALKQAEQINQQLKDAKHIVLTFGTNASGDAIASTLALYTYLHNIGKQVDMICHNFVLPKQFSFLKSSDAIASALSQLKTFIMTVDVKETGVQELSYDLVGEKLRIFVTPKKGLLGQQHVRTAQSDFKYDLVVTLGTQDLNALGEIYTKHQELFEKTPVINIDQDPSNEHYGHVNVVDVTATSTAEVLFDLLRSIGSEYIDADVATALLTGMISKTQSFKTENVKPHTLSVASKLIGLGADRDNVIEHLYRTRTIAALKLWGQALVHLHSKPEIGLVWTTITRDDFSRSGAQKHDLVEVIDELISNAPEAKMSLLIHEDPQTDGEIHAILAGIRGYNVLQILGSLNPVGNRDQVHILLRGKSLKQAEELILSEIEKKVPKQ